MTPQEQNELMRKLLIQNSPKIMVKLPTVTGVMGGTTRVKLNNTGLITRLFADITIPFTNSVNPTSIRQKSVFAAVPKIQLFDFDGSTRVNTSAYLLSVLNAMRGRGEFAGMAQQLGQSGLVASAGSQVNAFRGPEITVTATQIRFVLEIPVAADTMKGDLRGMLAAQFVSGDLQLAFDFASVLNGTLNDDFVFGAGTLVNGAPTVTVYQEYYLPQKIQGVTAIPQMDIATVYELGVYGRTTDNIVSGVEKLLNFPVVRVVNSVCVDYLNNSLLGGGTAAADIQNFVVYANGNNKLYEANQYLQSQLQRNQLGSDLPQGTYMLDFAGGPIKIGRASCRERV